MHQKKKKEQDLSGMGKLMLFSPVRCSLLSRRQALGYEVVLFSQASLMKGKALPKLHGWGWQPSSEICSGWNCSSSDLGTIPILFSSSYSVKEARWTLSEDWNFKLWFLQEWRSLPNSLEAKTGTVSVHKNKAQFLFLLEYPVKC